jgi:hypothetical protein
MAVFQVSPHAHLWIVADGPFFCGACLQTKAVNWRECDVQEETLVSEAQGVLRIYGV